MILANTKTTGYSLGLPLYWPSDPAQLSTGIIQGLSISLLLNAEDAVPELEITKYAVQGNHVSLAISGPNIFCSMEGDLSDAYTVYTLESSSPEFLRGWVGLYPDSTEKLMNLTGARINPLYIHASIRQEVAPGVFCLRNGGQVVTSTSLIGMTVKTTADVTVTSTFESGGIVYDTEVNTSVTPAEGVDSSSIYYINGLPVSANGEATLQLPTGWTVMGNKLCARVGNPSTTPSCVATDYITEGLGPQNFAGDYNPLSAAFDDGVLNMSPIYNGTVRFNAEYEPGGLVWDELSAQHDGAAANDN